MRCFISLNIDNKNKGLVRKIQNELKDRINKPDLVRFENPKNFHLTLFFISEVNEEKIDDIHNALKKGTANKFGELNFFSSKIDAFPDLKKPKVLFLDSANKENKIFELAEIIKNILKNFGFAADKSFHPHITLGRVKGNIKLNSVENMNIDMKFSVSRVSIMQSRITASGAEHKELFAINL